MEIRGRDSLREAWMWLKYLENCRELVKVENTAALAERIRKQKAAIRDYSKDKAIRRVIKYDGYGGYVELINMGLPAGVYDKEFAKEFFEHEYYVEMYPSAYDCTGQAFTAWYKVFERGGMWHAYHYVGVDV